MAINFGFNCPCGAEYDLSPETVKRSKYFRCNKCGKLITTGYEPTLCETITDDNKSSRMQANDPSILSLNYEWIQEVPSCRRDVDDRTVYYTDELKRTLKLRKEVSNEIQQYHVSYSAQLVSGRHASAVDTKDYTSLSAAIESLLEFANKYAPQGVIEKIIEDLKKV